MRVLLVQPEDSPRRGPWSRQSWDLIVDLGKSSLFSAEEWARQCGCPVLRSDSFRRGIADARLVRELFSAGRGLLLDEEGIDWWDLVSLLLVPEALAALELQRVAVEIDGAAELWTAREGGTASILAILLEKKLHTFEDSRLARSASQALRYAGLLQRFSAAQIKEIVLDKYDSDYRWRSRFSTRPLKQAEPVVLLPSAYRNVSRMAAAYASLLPSQKFLMIATRPNAKQLVTPSNVCVRDLAIYAKGDPPAAEIASLQSGWIKLKSKLCASPEIELLSRAGQLNSVPDWIRDGLIARNAWREVIEHEPVCGVLCGDDSNRYTRLPVLLAANRNIPTVDFHHGAFDGRYLFKDLPCDIYLAKNEVERDYMVRVCGLSEDRVTVGAPFAERALAIGGCSAGRKSFAVFFSEPYEVIGMRAEEVYRELLPSLCRLVREHGRGLIVKLHPFESRRQRRIMIREILIPTDRECVRVVDGPLTDELLSQAWFGLTVESTTVMDCLRSNVPCFLCGWLPLTTYGYLEQYQRFGIGEVLQSAQEIASIPTRMTTVNQQSPQGVRSDTINPAILQRLLTTRQHQHEAAKPGA